MIDPNLKAKDRIHESLPEDIKELMREHVLSDEEHIRVLNDIKEKSYEGKNPVEKPKFTIVLGQTGAGKSNLTACLTTNDDNMVIIDSDKYKAFRADSRDIQREHLAYYAYLTAPDAYQHRDEMLYDTMRDKYNILLECATSEKEGMFVNIDNIRRMGYNIEIAVLGVSQINSLISVHERYENQIALNLASAKLTSIDRHDDSFTSLRKCIKDINEDEINISVYRRGNGFLHVPEKIYESNSEIKNFASAVEALDYVQLQDKKRTLRNFPQRYAIVQQQMLTRKAPQSQMHQLNQVLDRYNEEIEKDIQK